MCPLTVGPTSVAEVSAVYNEMKKGKEHGLAPLPNPSLKEEMLGIVGERSTATMAVERMPSESGDDDRLTNLARLLDLTSPDNTLVLSQQDRLDLALFDSLTRSQAGLELVLGVEAETVEAETWNYQTATQLAHLAQVTGEIPFGTRAELFDLTSSQSVGATGPQPSTPSATAIPSATATPSARAKGKQREGAVLPAKRSVYDILPRDAKELWAGRQGEKCYPYKNPHFPIF